MGWTTNLNWWSPDFWTINSGCRWPVASQPNQSLRHWFSRWIQWCRVRLPLFNRFLGWWWAMGVMVWYIKWVRKSGKYGRICLSHMFSHCFFWRLRRHSWINWSSFLFSWNFSLVSLGGQKWSKELRPRLSIFFKAVEDVPAGGSIDVEVDSVAAVHLIFQMAGSY